MNKHPLEFTAQDLEKLKGLQLLVSIGSKSNVSFNSPILKTFKGSIESFDLASIDPKPAYVKFRLNTGKIEEYSIIEIKGIQVIR